MVDSTHVSCIVPAVFILRTAIIYLYCCMLILSEGTVVDSTRVSCIVPAVFILRTADIFILLYVNTNFGYSG